jgi:hypothetical protein
MKRMAVSGELLPNDLVLQEGATTWMPASQIVFSAKAILWVLRKHFGSMSNPYLDPDIPSRKLRNVRSKYARFLLPGEEVLLVYDGTLFGAATDGFLFTDRGIGCAGTLGDPHYCTYSEINPDEMRADPNWFRSGLVFKGRIQAYVFPPDRSKVCSTVQQALREIKEADLVQCLWQRPSWPITIERSWLTPTVLSLAQAAYENRSLPAGTLDNAHLAVLSDALEEAACDNADILNHLRQPEVHFQGCWVLHLLLGKS